MFADMYEFRKATHLITLLGKILEKDFISNNNNNNTKKTQANKTQTWPGEKAMVSNEFVIPTFKRANKDRVGTCNSSTK